MRQSVGVLGFFIVVALASAAHSQPVEIEIKGLKIGTPRAEVNQKFGSFDEFRIAGVSGYHIKYTASYAPKGFCIGGCYAEIGLSPLSADYDDDGLLESWRFTFSANNFAALKLAVTDKYPSTVCKESVLVNGFGGQFQQEACTVEDDKTVLSLSRYSGARDKGSLFATSKKSIERIRQRMNQNKKDI